MDAPFKRICEARYKHYEENWHLRGFTQGQSDSILSTEHNPQPAFRVMDYKSRFPPKIEGNNSIAQIKGQLLEGWGDVWTV